jgi:polyferredoxin
MKLERERDIVAFKGKNWREKSVLRAKAEERDPWILRLKMLKYFLVFMPIWSLSMWLVSQFFPHFPFLATLTTLIIVGWPIDMVLYALLIVPRIRRALDTNTQPAV